MDLGLGVRKVVAQKQVEE